MRRGIAGFFRLVAYGGSGLAYAGAVVLGFFLIPIVGLAWLAVLVADPVVTDALSVTDLTVQVGYIVIAELVVGAVATLAGCAYKSASGRSDIPWLWVLYDLIG
jgi:hypothetical protein